MLKESITLQPQDTRQKINSYFFLFHYAFDVKKANYKEKAIDYLTKSLMYCMRIYRISYYFTQQCLKFFKQFSSTHDENYILGRNVYYYLRTEQYKVIMDRLAAAQAIAPTRAKIYKSLFDIYETLSSLKPKSVTDYQFCELQSQMEGLKYIFEQV